jgi:periplasmic copper chaperone A
MIRIFTLFIGCWFGSAYAEEVTVGNLKISNPWARATPKGASVGGAYMTITNTGSVADRILGGPSDASNHFEIHEMSMENGVMKMRPLGKIKPGKTVELKPGGYHVMFVGLKAQFEEGQHVKEKAGNIGVDFAVQGIGAQTGASTDKMQMQHGH